MSDFAKAVLVASDLFAESTTAQARIATLEAALRSIREYLSWGNLAGDQAALARATLEIGAQPGIGPIAPELQDYKVQCRCGWMGTVSALKSLPEFKMGCPDCSTEFVPIDKIAFPVNRGEKQ